jgi:Hypervirulence associated proteins TUDOR domain
MTESFRKGTRVKWNWGEGVGRGRIKERFARQVERSIEGALIRRNGSSENPAYLVQADNGSEVLKLGSELSRA